MEDVEAWRATGAHLLLVLPVPYEEERSQGGYWAGLGPIRLPPPFFAFIPFFFVEKTKEEKKGKRGHKNYNNNFYELPFSRMFRCTSFGSDILRFQII